LSKIVSIATGVPAYKHLQEDIFSFADKVYNPGGLAIESRKLKYLYQQSGISTRYSSIPDYSLPAGERQFYSTHPNLEPFPLLEKRMEWYDAHAAPISVKAIQNCIKDKITAAQITHLITVSCTGMSAPGLDLQVMEAMQLPADIFRTSVNFMGCYAAIHALKIADALCKTNSNANVMIVCTELCTLHFQKSNTIDNLMATLLFADGCAALLVQPGQSQLPGLRLTNFYAAVAFRGKQDMSWHLSSHGFLMKLSGYVPVLVKEDFDVLITKALEKSGISKADVDYWCIHPGGKKILQAIEQSTGISQHQLAFSYSVLNEYGNMSSPTILFVLQKIINDLQNNPCALGKRVLGAAFGPGLTMETFTAVYD
jgi:predicted naringenin-chalcone synthase